MIRKQLKNLGVALFAAGFTGAAYAATPFGAEDGANADGSIPAWTGGITSPVSGYSQGAHHPDPYAGEGPQFTINAGNMSQYGDMLTAGHKAMLQTYPSFSMNVYPTHRSASAPQWVYDATQRNASSAQLVSGGNGVAGAIHGIPFPNPKTGVEAVWNHMLRWRGVSALREYGQAAVTRGGDFNMVDLKEDFYVPFYDRNVSEADLNNIIVYFKQRTMAPARLAGSILMVHETLDQTAEHRKAWLYNPGQRRVRRAPNVAFDNPGTASDGLRTSDQLDMFNGSPERYDWTLVGKREMFVPYNSYRLHSNSLRYSDVISPLHLNPANLRYEKHRVWVVDGVLKPGTRHIYQRRTFYIDEDSWQILAVDQYDNRGQIWRVSEGHGINYYEVPAYWTTLEVHYDLQSGRYLAVGLNNEGRPYDFTKQFRPTDFTTNKLRQEGQR